MRPKSLKILIPALYDALLELHGNQGWWPVTQECSGLGYHPKIAGIPSSRAGRFEVCAGAILTQNTSWKQVALALEQLTALGWLCAEKMIALDRTELATAIRQAGYANQKSAYLQTMANWFVQEGDNAASCAADDLRDALLQLKGIGPETADSIALYAFHKPTFVIDAYTRRIGEKLGFWSSKATYGMCREIFQSNLPADTLLYQEFHALLVQHAKQYYAGKDRGGECPLPKMLFDDAKFRAQ